MSSRSLHLSPNFDLIQLRPYAATHRILTATPAIARRLGVAHQSLEQWARQILARQGWAVISPWRSQPLLIEAIADLLPNADSVAMAQWLRPTVRSLLQSGANLALSGTEATSIALAPKVHQVLAIAQNYREKLQRRAWVDPAELFWQALRVAAVAQLAPEPIVVCGYLHPAADWLAWVEAIAAPGSHLVLPCSAADWFSATRDAVAQLQAQGWTVCEPEIDHQNAQAEPGNDVTRSASSPVSSANTQINHLETDPATDTATDTATGTTTQTTINTTATYTAYPDREAEVRGVLAQIKHTLATGCQEQELAIVVRDQSGQNDYPALLAAIAWEFGVPLHWARSQTLKETRLGAWTNLFLETWQQNFAFEVTASWLQHPLTPTHRLPSWNKVRRKRPDFRQAWEELGVNFAPIEAWKKTTRSAWVKRFQQVLDVWQIESRCQAWAEEITAFESLQDALTEYAQSDGAGDRAGDLSGDLLGNLSGQARKSTTTQPEKLTGDRFAQELNTLLNYHPVTSLLMGVPRNGVVVQTPSSIVGTQYAHVFVLGLIEGEFPQPVKNDTVIDFFSRRQLANLGIHLPAAIDLARHETRQFAALLQVASQHLHLSYPQAIQKDATLKSPYLEQFAIPAHGSPATASTAQTTETDQTAHQTASTTPILIASRETARRLLWLSPPPGVTVPIADRVLSHARHCYQVELDRELSPRYSIYDGLTQKPRDPDAHTFTASQLSDLGQCGFKWFSRYVLRAYQPQDKELELSNRLRGQFYHRVLEKAMRSAIGLDEPREVILANLDNAFTEAEEELSLTRFPAWSVQRREHLSLLRRTIAADSFIAPDAKILQLEQNFEGEWYGVKVRGTIDRADETPRGVTLIEYKTRSTKPTRAKDENGELKFDVQLQLYVEAAGAALFPDRTISQAHYYSLTKAESISKVDQSSPEANQAFIERMRSHLQTGAYPVQPDARGKVCDYCDSASACRKGERLRRKVAV